MKRMKQFFAGIMMGALVLTLIPTNVYAKEQTQVAQDAWENREKNTEFVDKVFAKNEEHDATTIKNRNILYKDGFEYYVEDERAYITKFYGDAKNVIIPSTLGGYPVYEVEEEAFYYKNKIESLTISEGIEKLETNWITRCSRLKNISYPSTLKMEDIEENYVFAYDCYNLKKIVISEKNPYFKVVGSDVYTKDGSTFVFHPQNASEKKVNVLDGTKKIEMCAFINAFNLEEVVLPDTVESIGESAFAYSSVKKVNLPENLSKLEYGTFAESSLESIHIPTELHTIEDSAFALTQLKSITLAKDNTNYILKNNCLIENKSYAHLVVYENGNEDTICIVPDEVKILDRYAFSGATNLKSIVLPNSIIWDLGQSFQYCVSLENITMSESLEMVGQGIFSYSQSLKKVVFPSSVQSINSYCFTGIELEEIWFMGDKPKVYSELLNRLEGEHITIRYPKGSTWETDALEGNKFGYEGTITWKAFELEEVDGNVYLETPKKPNKIVNTVNGVNLGWEEVPGAGAYQIMRSENGKNGTYTKIAGTVDANYTDKNVTPGKTYYYKVAACHVQTGLLTSYSEPIGINYLATPNITGRLNVSSGIKLTWNKVAGATGYAIYRKSYNGTDSWKRLALIKDANTTSWINTDVKDADGKGYRYTVRAVAGKNHNVNSEMNSGKTMARLTTRTLSSAKKNSATSIKCVWNKTTQANGYEVRFMVGDKVYKTAVIGKNNTTSAIITGLKSGQKYKIQVRSYKKVSGIGVFYSSWSAAKYVQL